MNYFKNYVNHMLRFYARYHDKKDISDFKKKEADLKNWIAVKTILDSLPEKKCYIEVYKRRDTLSDNVYELSKNRINQDII